MNYKIVDSLFFLICFTLPFSMIPLEMRFVFFGALGNHLLSYPLFIGFCYSIYCHYKYGNVFVNYKKVIIFLSIYASVLLISLANGLYNFPYYEDILSGPITQVKRIPDIISYFSRFGIEVLPDHVLKLFLFIRPLRDIFVDVFYMFGTSYLIYCWYRTKLDKAISILCSAIKCILPIIIIYGVIEYLSLSGNSWCREFLRDITPHILECHKDAWPPLFWYSKQIRLFFAEPSFIGNYMAILLPVIIFMYFEKKRCSCYWLFCFFSVFSIVFLSKARTATAMALGILALYLIVNFLVYKGRCFKKSIVLIGVVVCSFLLSLTMLDYMNNHHSSYTSNVTRKITVEQYVNHNILSVVSTNQRSNSARFARLKSNFRVGIEHPFLGIGRGLITPYAVEQFTKEERKNWEINRWLNRVRDNGLLSERIGAMNEYVDRFAETGMFGLFIFLCPFIFAYKKLYKYIGYGCSQREILLFVMLTSCLVSGFNLFLNVIWGTWIVLALCYADVEEVFI